MKKCFQELDIEIARPSQTTVVLQNLPPQRPAVAEPDEGQRRAAPVPARHR
jgi:hypothetical protein